MRKVILKRTADALEKLAIGSLLVGLFRENEAGVFVGIGCLAACYVITVLEARA
jgi:hypothetical protein